MSERLLNVIKSQTKKAWSGSCQPLVRKNYVRCIVALTVFAAHASPSAAQPVDEIDLQHFQYVRTITLSDPGSVQPEPLLIAEIKSLDVAADGRMLVVDLLG